MPDVVGPRGERTTDWSSEREGLARLEDEIKLLRATLTAAHGGKPKVVPTVRPITAVDRAKRRKRREDHAALVARVLPERG